MTIFLRDKVIASKAINNDIINIESVYLCPQQVSLAH